METVSDKVVFKKKRQSLLCDPFSWKHEGDGFRQRGLEKTAILALQFISVETFFFYGNDL